MKIRRSGDGMHLFDRRTGLNVLIDEVQIPQAEWDAAPRFVSFALTNLCDLHCPFCYAPKYPAVLDCKEVITWCGELDHAGCLGVGFGGGEPTLYPHFGFLCRELATTTNLSIGFTTHAHRFTEGLVKDLQGTVNFVRVSMDGVYETYESLRHRPFEQLLNQLKLVRDTCAFGINYVVNSTTVGELQEAVDIAVTSGAQEFLLLPEHSNTPLSAEVVSQLETWVCARHQGIRLAISEVGATAAIPTAQPFSCDTGTRAYMHVNAAGRVSRSSYDHETSVPVERYNGILAAIGAYV